MMWWAMSQEGGRDEVFRKMTLYWDRMWEISKMVWVVMASGGGEGWWRERWKNEEVEPVWIMPRICLAEEEEGPRGTSALNSTGVPLWVNFIDKVV